MGGLGLGVRVTPTLTLTRVTLTLTPTPTKAREVEASAPVVVAHGEVGPRGQQPRDYLGEACVCRGQTGSGFSEG